MNLGNLKTYNFSGSTGPIFTDGHQPAAGSNNSPVECLMMAQTWIRYGRKCPGVGGMAGRAGTDWTGQQFSPCVPGTALPQLWIPFWADRVVGQRNHGDPTAGRDGHGYEAGRGLDIAEAEATLRGKSCNSPSFPLRVQTTGFIGSNH